MKIYKIKGVENSGITLVSLVVTIIILLIIVNLNGHDIQIEGTGEVKKVPDIISQMIKNPEEYYGKEVTNYKDDGKTYRVFYIDRENYFGDGDNTIYLKADYSGSVMCLAEYDANQTKVREMNPQWAKERGNNENEWNYNEKAAAWLCDPTKWTDYCDPEKAQYAVGGPSVEMYVKSYNEAYSESENIYVLGANYRATAVPGYIYTLNGAKSTLYLGDDYSTGDNSLDYKKFANMYCGKNGGKTGDWWLASPCAKEPYRVCFVYGPSAKLDFRNYNSPNRSGISPLICLTSSFVPEIKE